MIATIVLYNMAIACCLFQYQPITPRLQRSHAELIAAQVTCTQRKTSCMQQDTLYVHTCVDKEACLDVTLWRPTGFHPFRILVKTLQRILNSMAQVWLAPNMRMCTYWYTYTSVQYMYTYLYRCLYTYIMNICMYAKSLCEDSLPAPGVRCLPQVY